VAVVLLVVVSFIEFGVVDARETTTARARKKSRFRI